MRWLVLVTLAAAGCQGHTSFPDWERMRYQHNFRPFVYAPYFADGRAMRPPPEGTIPRGTLLGDPALTDGVVNGQYETALPIPVTRALMVRGRDRFEIYCAACHGLLGDGKSEVARHMELRPPPSLVDPPVSLYPPGRIFQVATLGYGLMPSYAHALPPNDRWAVVAYLHALRLSRAVALSSLPGDLQRAARKEIMSEQGERSRSTGIGARRAPPGMAKP